MGVFGGAWKKSRPDLVEFTAWDLVDQNSTKLEEWPAKMDVGLVNLLIHTWSIDTYIIIKYKHILFLI